MQVMVTGGSGHLGHYVIDELYRRGHSVVNADVVRAGTVDGARSPAFADMRKSWPSNPQFFTVNVTDYGQVISAMDSCDAVIANLTPFRGISADPGTVFEVGYIIGQGKAAFGFTMDRRHYRERAGAADRDELGHSIEDFEMNDNLMIEGGLQESGGQLLVAEQPGEHRFFSAELFRRCVQALIDYSHSR